MLISSRIAVQISSGKPVNGMTNSSNEAQEFKWVGELEKHVQHFRSKDSSVFSSEDGIFITASSL